MVTKPRSRLAEWGPALRRAPWVVRYALATAIVALATGLQLMLWPHIPRSPFLCAYPAVIAAAAMGGFGAGTLATVLSALTIAYYFLPPVQSFHVSGPEDMLAVGVFVALGLSVVWLIHYAQSTRDRLELAIAKERRAIAVRDEVLAVVAHDLKNPLTTISLSASILERGNESTPAHVARIRRASERASRLVANLLDASAIDAGTFHIDPHEWELGPLVHTAIAAFEPVAAMRGINLVTTPVPEGTVYCDYDRVEQALSNVLGNAVLYTPTGGAVTTAVTTSERGIHFEIRDSGPGMSQEQIAHACDRFWRGRTSTPGSGLGLFIARGVVEAHGGHMGIISDGEHGTVIVMDLPQQLTPLPQAPFPQRPELH